MAKADRTRQDSEKAGEENQELLHVLINRFSVALSTTQRLRSRLAKLEIAEVRDELDVLASAMQECSNVIRAIRSGGADILGGGGSAKDSLREGGEGDQADEGDRTRLRHVLYVENDPQVKKYTTSVLRRAGWQVTAVDDVNEAREELCNSRFDVLLSDVRFPSGSGLELATEAGRQSPEVCVVIMTGWSVTDKLPENVSFVLEKPVEDETLLLALEQACATCSSG